MSAFNFSRLGNASAALGIAQAARLVPNRAAVMEEMKQDISLESSQAKLFCVEVANRIVGDCIQTVGRYGCLRDSLFDLYLCYDKVIGAAGGSLEVMKNNIARKLLGS